MGYDAEARRRPTTADTLSFSPASATATDRTVSCALGPLFSVEWGIGWGGNVV